MFAAGSALLFAGLLDLLDGAVARVSGTVSKFGGVLDSTLDRYGDGVVYAGLLFFFLGRSTPWYVLLCISAILGSFTVSYVRARAECEMDRCKVGFWERGERIVFLAAGLLIANPVLSLLWLATGTHLTTFQRLCYAGAGLSDPGIAKAWKGPFFVAAHSRRDARYVLKVAVLIASLIFVRLPY